MVDRYVGPGGNDGNSGLTWALRKLTLTGVEDTPVVAGDDIYVGPGVYREKLTVDVSGGAGTEITYMADVTGCNTDNVGGVVRVTGSDNDQAAVRDHCVEASVKDYRIFRGFRFDFSTDELWDIDGDSDNWTVEDCTFTEGMDALLAVDGTANYWMIRRCLFSGAKKVCVHFGNDAIHTGNHEIRNCLFLGRARAWSWSVDLDLVDTVDIRNCTFLNGDAAIGHDGTGGAANSVVVENCIIVWNNDGLTAAGANQMIEDFNTFFGNNVDRTNVAVGGNSETYPPLLANPLLFSGAGQVSGFKFPWWFGMLSQWSQVGEITGNAPEDYDLVAIPRPPNNASKSWGCLQRHDKDRETVTVQAGTASMKMDDAARWQMWVPVTDTSTTITVYVYREANYAGLLPQMIIKQPCVADRVTTDVAAASQWNQLSDTFVPDADTTYVVVELVSRNTAAAGNYDVFFDTLQVS